MERRSLFSRIFGNDKSTVAPETATTFTVLNDQQAVFTNYRGDFQYDPDILKCVDAIARNGAKMHPKHIRSFKGKTENLRGPLYKLLSKQPNELQNAYKFYYQIIAELELHNNAVVYIQRDSNLSPTGLYPLNYTTLKFYEFKDKIWVKFKFGRGKERFVPYDDCIHLTRFISDDGMFGGKTAPIIKILSMKHVLDEGMVNAIKTTQSIKGILKSTKTMLKPEDVKAMRDQFVEDFVSKGDKSGIGGLDATTDFIPVKIEPTTASPDQTKEIDKKILSYFGISDGIVQSNYTEDEWNAFYESVLEPILLQMSLEFSNKIFTPTEKNFGNEIVFESNRLQYASNKTKIEIIRYCSNIITRNEQREILNLAPVEGGDVFLIDQNHEIDDSMDEGGETDEGN